MAVLINDSINPYSYNKNAADVAHLKHFMEVYLISDEKAAIWQADSDYGSIKERLEEIGNEKMALQQRIAELETENERLTALLEKKKKNGTARKFTLVQIVNYCKGRVDWNDVKSIVAMLNRLLRRIATEEDSKLVDSIEEEFINRRYGNTFYAPVGQVVEHVERIEAIDSYGKGQEE